MPALRKLESQAITQKEMQRDRCGREVEVYIERNRL